MENGKWAAGCIVGFQGTGDEVIYTIILLAEVLFLRSSLHNAFRLYGFSTLHSMNSLFCRAAYCI